MRYSLMMDRVIYDVNPADDPVKDHPENRMVNAPRNGDGEHASEAPETYTRRSAFVFHVISSVFPRATVGFALDRHDIP